MTSPDVEKRAKPTTIDLGGRVLPLNLKTNARARRMTLKIEPGGHAVSLTVPPGLARHEVEGFLRRHHDWLLERMSRFEGHESHIADGGTVKIFGVPHTIRHSGNLRGITEARNEPDGMVLRVSGPAESIGRRVADYLKKEARREITDRVKAHAAASGKSYVSISFKDTRSRWGSCSSVGNLNFSWRIAMAPLFVVDYLAAHEVAHLSEMNHGPRFWALCERLCPRTPEARKWLKNEGSFLHAVRFDAPLA
ncbi:M48 family metallopeptidase [Martelella lutilitoris]|uniref:M48 family metallopeptidase n=1 Tax=Martelella lutilitoris TaxID=2583532 RepID=A0A5C4JX24_9HYPH|nr:SprT family zinc-dependent metalloprotease [Martelella lutilitoris]TNB49767.1 M48 family metallopeptidase [Martelella lutilitoris]